MPLRWPCGLWRRRRWRQHSRQNYQNDAGVIACSVFYPSRARARCIFHVSILPQQRMSGRRTAHAPRRASTYFHRHPNSKTDFNLEQFNWALVRSRSMGSLKSCIEIKMCDNSNKINHINSNIDTGFFIQFLLGYRHNHMAQRSIDRYIHQFKNIIWFLSVDIVNRRAENPLSIQSIIEWDRTTNTNIQPDTNLKSETNDAN